MAGGMILLVILCVLCFIFGYRCGNDDNPVVCTNIDYEERYKVSRHEFNEAINELYKYKAIDVIQKELEKEHKSRSLLHGFINYCNDNPGQRFWQALTNWSKYDKIYGYEWRESFLPKKVTIEDLEDVFYKEDF